MKKPHNWQIGLTTAAALLAAGVLAGCSNTKPDITTNIRHQLDGAGLKQVSVSEDRSNGVLTLAGNVADDNAKSQAQAIATSAAGGEVVANQIAVLPAGREGDAKTVNADLDRGIKENLDAALTAKGMHKDVSFSVNNRVVTLTGDVRSQARRDEVQSVAAGVPYVQQVVNELQVKHQKASSSE